MYVGERINYTNKDRVCISVPLYHCFGMVMGNLACINYGASMIYPSDGFSAAASLHAVTKYRCTSIYGVPTMV
jgi:fatty-acyl-CoA synthase